MQQKKTQVKQNNQDNNDAGDEDEGGFYHGCAQLFETLKSRGVKVQNHLKKGHHTVQYIQNNLEDYFMFYSK